MRRGRTRRCGRMTAAVRDLLCANTERDVLVEYNAAWRRRARCTIARCVHNGAYAGAVVACGVDPEQLFAAWSAVWQSGGGLCDVAGAVLPADAHVRASGRLAVAMDAGDASVATIRRWRAREQLLATLADATRPRGWFISSNAHTTAWAMRGSRVVAAGFTPVAWPTGNHAVQITKLRLPLATVRSALLERR